jgi:hypothetical protein
MLYVRSDSVWCVIESERTTVAACNVVFSRRNIGYMCVWLKCVESELIVRIKSDNMLKS